MLQCCGCVHGNEENIYSNLDEVVVDVRIVFIGPRNAIRQARRVPEVH